MVVQRIVQMVMSPVARTLIPKKPRWSLAVWGFSVLRGKPWVPSVLGGSGHTRFCWTDGLPFQPVSEDLRLFYLTAVGYHLSEVVMHTMQKRLPDFWEMLLHHVVTLFLVSFSYLLNYVRVGSLVLFLHGATDIFIYASKVLVDAGSVRIITVSYFSLVVSYAWFRIYVFPMYVMRSAWIESLQEAAMELNAWGFLNFALCVLFILHVYWFSLVIKIGVNFRRTGEARDMVSNLSNMDMQDKKKA
jgi:hypothetical protein